MSNSEPIKPVDASAPPSTATVVQQNSRAPASVKIGTLGSYLLGSREAVLTLAVHRDTLWLGLIFVMSAALAREYDGEDLLYEPWHLVLPLAASLGTSFLLFGLTSVVARCHGVTWRGFWSRYRIFLGLYWMTAPLAWLYAIPVERFLSAGDATSTNLWFLAIVSFWRVLLITRVLSVTFGASPVRLFFVVMLFADSVAIGLVSQIDVQVLAVMGGVRLTDAETVLAATKLLVLLFGVLSWPIWLIGTLVVACTKAPKWVWTRVATSRLGISKTAWSLATAAVIVWGIALPWTQSEQQLRGAVERDFKSGRFNEMLTRMSAHQRDEFPPHWDPPPRIGASRERRHILQVVRAMSPDTSPWVRQLFLDKFTMALGGNFEPQETLWFESDPVEIISFLESQPDGDETLRRIRRSIWNLRTDRHVSSEAKQKVNTVMVRLLEPPELEGDMRHHAWPEEYSDLWYEYLTCLQTMERPWPQMNVRVARLRKLLDEPQFVPPPIQALIEELLKQTPTTHRSTIP